MRGLDVLVSQPTCDPERIAVTGLSGGGWQTIFIGALDPRVALINAVAGFSSLRTRARYPGDLGDSEQMPCDLGALADYTHLMAMRAPCPTMVTYNAADPFFASTHALQPLLAQALPVFAAAGCEDALRWHANHDPGTHNYDTENREAFYRALSDCFFPEARDVVIRDVPAPKLPRGHRLRRVIPAKNRMDFHRLAMDLAKRLPRRPELPVDPAEADAWRESRRELLRSLVRLPALERLTGRALRTCRRGALQAVHWWLNQGSAWTIPAVELAADNAVETTLMLGDDGRASLQFLAARELAAGRRVVACDPFDLGEARTSSSAHHLLPLLISCLGERPLGIQAGQIIAMARWCADRAGSPVHLIADGPRASLIALVAAALEPDAIRALELQGSLPSLKTVIRRNWTVNIAPEMFCFGLLEHFDMPELAALASPRPVTTAQPAACEPPAGHLATSKLSPR